MPKLQHYKDIKIKITYFVTSGGGSPARAWFSIAMAA